MTLHGGVWVWGGTVLIALLALALLFMVHGEVNTALGLLFGANVVGILVWLLGTSLRRAYPPLDETDDPRRSVLNRVKEEESSGLTDTGTERPPSPPPGPTPTS